MIVAAPNAPDGSVTTLPSYTPSDFPPTTAILCRNTAPLLAFAMTLLRKRVPCHILGRDIERGLLRTVDTLKAFTMEDFRRRLSAYCDREARRARTKAARGAVEDRCAALSAIASGCVDVADIKRTIEDLFKDKVGTLTLSTVHKAKGLEWETVFILDRGLMPSRYAEAPWELTQEQNIQYVAVTRAKLHLKYINSDTWK